MVDGRSPRRSAARRRIPAVRRGGAVAGYNLVILMVMVTVMNVLVAAALPTWSTAIQRQKEKELIFRGLQYAEAIRVFQLRTGRYPVSLRELLEVEPRAIRQLWTDPFRDDGKWGLVLAAGGPRGQDLQGRDPRQRTRRSRDDETGFEDDELEEGEEPIPVEDVSEEGKWAGGLSEQGVQATGPIVGVRSISKKDSITTFMGSSSIADWEFTAELIPILPEAPSLEVVPRLTSDYIGRPFPSDVEMEQGMAPDDVFEERARDDRRGDSQRQRRNQDRNRR